MRVRDGSIGFMVRCRERKLVTAHLTLHSMRQGRMTMKWPDYFRVLDFWGSMPPDQQRLAAIALMALCAAAVIITLFLGMIAP